jgi:hypothetical protein
MIGAPRSVLPRPLQTDWKSGAAMSPLAAHFGIRFRELVEAFDDVTIER